ncbi:hypothetical protein [Chromobacterium haemolyticum]|uniref:hypothetical protein n=1 Tax=Chromobacterium haemolyticum TaxID=394935 RepID=UPI00113002D5|nr:hypothetical protein [Chromobacterium haemolyticum]
MNTSLGSFKGGGIGDGARAQLSLVLKEEDDEVVVRWSGDVARLVASVDQLKLSELLQRLRGNL